MSAEQQRSLTLALIGAPNAGKSTLVNQLVGSKISIVSPKEQTTRNALRGIRTEGNTQLVLVDTPGIFAPKRGMDRAMVEAAWDGANEADCILLIVDARAGISEELDPILKRLSFNEKPVFIALNKVDLVKKEKLLTLTIALHERGRFAETFMISALTGDGVPAILKTLLAQAKTQPWMFPEDQVADASLRFLAQEITREQCFLQLHQELPYGLAIETEQWQETPHAITLHQAIIVERDSHKAMVVGKGGSRIKLISTRAREAMSELVDKKVHLFLHVRVEPDWLNKHPITSTHL